MTIEDILNDARSVVKKVVPDHVEITQVDFEGPTIVIYTKNMEVFAESNDLVRQIAQQLRRRIVVRPDPSLLAPPDEAEKVIREVIPAEAQITGIYFETETGEVTIEALSPGMVIGRHGSVLNEIKSKVLIDCGVLISEDNGSPYLNAPEVLPLSSLDAVVITHAHLDHSGLVPALYKYGYEGPIYTTPPTRDLMSLLQLDFIKVAMGEARKSAYDSSNIRKAVANTIPLKYGETTDIAPDVRLTFQNAGHILGSAVGRSQEVMLVLEDAMRNRQIPEVPIYLDGMIWEATAIHTAYPEYLNSQLRTQIFQTGENPFLSPMFKRVETADMRANIVDDVEPCIVLATSGMMSGGPVLEYFKGWADNPLHALLFVGFQSEGSLGRRIQREAREVTLTDRGQPLTLPTKLDLETIDGFSGHSDRLQLLNYVGTMEPRPERVIVNHGEEYKCSDLASGLYKKFGLETRAPMNLETIRLK